MDFRYDYGYDYDYGYGYPGMEEMMMEFEFLFLGIVAAVLLLVLAVAAAIYVFKSIGFYSVAKRRGLRNPWLAWIPVAQYWIVGSLSDQYQYVVNGKVKNRRKVLLIVGAGSAVVSCVLQVVRLVLFVTGSDEAALVGGAVSLIAALAGFGLGIAATVFYYMSMYDLYTSFSPQNSVMFLVLSILFQITEPFFVFFNRNKDDGMPPRREAPVQSVVEAIPEPWDNPEL